MYNYTLFFSGWLYDITLDYTTTLLTCGGIAVIGIILIFIVAVHYEVSSKKVNVTTDADNRAAEHFLQKERKRTLKMNDEFPQEKRKRTFTITDGELYASVNSLNHS